MTKKSKRTVSDALMRSLLETVIRLLKRRTGEEFGVTIFVTPFGLEPDDRVMYASNCKREDMMEVLRVFHSYSEGTEGNDMPPARVN